MSAPTIEVLAIQAEQIRSQVEQLRAHLHAHSYESSLLTGTAVLMGQVVAGLRLEADPVLRAETKARLDRDAADRRKRLAVVRHGIDCRKSEHQGEGYMHGASDDSPYSVDGLTYCGRCHHHIETPAEVAADGRA